MPNRLALLGRVRLTGPDDARIRRASQQRRIALLAAIASSPDASVTRDRLLGLLWPERDERTARHLLADSLYVLRQSLGHDAIVVSTDAVRIAPELVWADVVEFRRATADSRWFDALQLYRGDFLDGFNLRNAAEFDHWALAERTRLRVTAARAAWSLAGELEQAGRITEAVAAAERRLELEKTDEAALRDVVRLLIASDNHARAESVARAFIERLAVDLGMAPSAETMRVLRDARALGAADPIVVVTPGTSRPRRPRKTDSLTTTILARGRYHWQQRTRVSLERAIDHFTRATERDPRALEAWCGLSDSWVVMGGRGYAPIAHAVACGLASAERALALDDTRPCVHTSIGGLNIIRRRWHESDSALRDALALDPHNADAHHWRALTLLTGFGDRDEAIREQAIAAHLNPVGAIQVGALGWHRYLRGDYELARLDMEPAVDLNADMEETHAGLARVAARLGDEAVALKTIAAGLTRCSDLRGDLLAEQASALAVLGDSRRGRRLALEAAASGAMPINLALAWASVGDATRAFQALDRESFLVYWAPQAVWWDPRFDGIRDDARFRRVRERVARAWSPEWS